MDCVGDHSGRLLGRFCALPAAQCRFRLLEGGRAEGLAALLSGFAAHWNKNSNPAWAFDTWFLNLFPRQEPFLFHPGGYATLNFIPTLGTMILGLIAAGVIRSQRAPWAKVKWLVVTGVVCLVPERRWGGWVFVLWSSASGLPVGLLFSGGWCLLLMAGFYVPIDLWGCKRWSFPLVVDWHELHRRLLHRPALGQLHRPEPQDPSGRKCIQILWTPLRTSGPRDLSS